GLPGAVGADHADPVAALDTQGEVADDRALAEALGDTLGDDHRLGADLVVGGERELRGPRATDHCRALRAHAVEGFEPALVALASRGHPALEPVRLYLQLCVELLRGARFLGVDLLFPRLIAAEAYFLAPQHAAVEPQRRPSQPLEKRAV